MSFIFFSFWEVPIHYPILLFEHLHFIIVELNHPHMLFDSVRGLPVFKCHSILNFIFTLEWETGSQRTESSAKHIFGAPSCNTIQCRLVSGGIFSWAWKIQILGRLVTRCWRSINKWFTCFRVKSISIVRGFWVKLFSQEVGQRSASLGNLIVRYFRLIPEFLILFQLWV